MPQYQQKLPLHPQRPIIKNLPITKMKKNIFKTKINQKAFSHQIARFLPWTLILFAVFAITFLPKSFAQESEATESSKEAVNVDLIKQRLLKSQVMGKQVGEKKHAEVGRVLRVTSEAITIETTDAETIILPLGEALLLNQKEEAIGVDKVVIDSWMTALGYMDSNKSFDPLYLIVATETLLPKTQVVTIGSISKITSKMLTILPRISPETSTEFTITKTTDFQDSDGNDASLNAFDEDMQVLVVGFSEDDVNEAAVIRSLAPKELNNE